MARVCIIKNGIVENVAIYDAVPSNPPLGYDSSYIAIEDNEAGPGWQWNGSAFSHDPVGPPTPISVPASPVLVAQAKLIIGASDVDNIAVAAGIAAALEIETGAYWVFFTEPQEDDNYVAFVQAQGDNGILAKVSYQDSEYIEIKVSDSSGNAVRPTSLSVSVQRIK